MPDQEANISELSDQHNHGSTQRGGGCCESELDLLEAHSTVVEDGRGSTAHRDVRVCPNDSNLAIANSVFENENRLGLR